MTTMNRQSFILNSRKVDIETLMIYLVLVLIALAALSYIFVSKDNLLTSSRWWAAVRYTRLGVAILGGGIWLLHIFHTGTIDYRQLKVFVCLLYTSMVGLAFYFPGFLVFFSDTFAWPIAYLVFYVYSKKRGELQQLGALISVLHFIVCLVLLFNLLLASSAYSIRGTVYHAISFLPFVLFLSKKTMRTVLTVFTVVLVVLSAKRTGLLAICIGFVCYMLIQVAIQETAKNKRKRVILVIIVGAGIYALAMVYSDYTEVILQRFQGISEDQGSGRQIIWDLIYRRFTESSSIHKLFGHGIQAVPAQLRPLNKHIFAHNCFYEYLYDLGIVGAFMLIMIYLSMLCSVIRLIKEKNKFAPTAGLCFSIILCYSLFSYCFEESNYILMLASYWGAMRGCYIREKLLKKEMRNNQLG